MIRLTGKQIRFARAVAGGACSVEAYRQAGYRTAGMKPTTVATEASRLARHPRVAEEVGRLRKLADHESLMDMKERRRLLAEIARGISSEKPTLAERIRAIETDAKLAGDLRPEALGHTSAEVDISVIMAALRPPEGSAEDGPLGPRLRKKVHLLEATAEPKECVERLVPIGSAAGPVNGRKGKAVELKSSAPHPLDRMPGHTLYSYDVE